MNQRGEVGILFAAGLTAMTGLTLLLALELQRDFNLIKKRTHLFLCTKQTKGELVQYLEFMGRTNWALQNINRVQIIAAFIPGLQGAALSSEKAKKLIQRLQDARYLQYKSSVLGLSNKKCPLDPKLIQGPFEMMTLMLKRNSQGLVILRSSSWSHVFYVPPYLIKLNFKAQDWESLRPVIGVSYQESKGSSSWRPF
jgi:hypothetical protein